MDELTADAIVVLGARIEADGNPAPATRRRVERAAQAFEQGMARTIIVTGGRRWYGHVEAVAMRYVLLTLGIPDRAIVLEPFALSTAENAYFSARIARCHGWRRLAVVSCHWHLPRASRNFRRCGISPVAVPALPGTVGPHQLLMRAAKEQVCTLLDAVRLRARFPW